MTQPCCPTCGHPLKTLAQVGPAGITAMRCTPCNTWWQKPEWR